MSFKASSEYSDELAVRVQGVGKSYTIFHNAPGHTTMGEAFAHRLRHPFERAESETFQAVRDVSFDVARGEVVGIVGRNGAGKSTLLKILSQITAPTTGQIDLYGRVGSLLEVGTGFHPELTGRENVFLNGAILGMKKREIERQFDAIVDFAGVEKFLDTPVKRYSSGMYVRLAFAVAAHLNPEILIIDEVLAVGDSEFQQKCLNKMQDVAQQGRTILFVSHNMVAVRALCTRAILLQNGQVAFDGPTAQATEYYMAEMEPMSLDQRADSANGEFDLSNHDNPYGKENHIRHMTLRNSQGQITARLAMNETWQLEVAVRDLDELPGTQILLFLKSTHGQTLGQFGTHMKPALNSGARSQEKCFVFQMDRLPLTPGVYQLDVLLRRATGAGFYKLDRVTREVSFVVGPTDVLGNGFEYTQLADVVFLAGQCEIRQSQPKPKEPIPIQHR